MNKKPEIQEIIETLHATREICNRFEKKYNMLSEHFYELYSQGMLDDDGLNFDFVDWAGSYKTVLACLREYDENMKQKTLSERIASIKSYAVVS